LLSRTITASPTIVGKRFNHVRQALALDEYRRSFEPRPYYVDPTHNYAATGQSIAQLWFAGAHCDVGGGYAQAEARLSQEPLLWMLQEAVDMPAALAGRPAGRRGPVDTQAVLGALAPPSPLLSPAPAPQPRSTVKPGPRPCGRWPACSSAIRMWCWTPESRRKWCRGAPVRGGVRFVVSR
jgi:hypothetical protein